MEKSDYLVWGIKADIKRENIKAACQRRAWDLHPGRSGWKRERPGRAQGRLS